MPLNNLKLDKLCEELDITMVTLEELLQEQAQLEQQLFEKYGVSGSAIDQLICAGRLSENDPLVVAWIDLQAALGWTP